jgi:putative zinc finger/helix-turn-helix YgiT family protein
MTVNLPTRLKCPECERGYLDPFTRNEEFDFDLGEETIKVLARDVPVERCDVCGMIASGPAAAKVRHEAICRAAGLLTPSEIKAIRDQFDWSQQYLAELTDFGVATISRWERGRLLQNRSNNKVLQALRDCPTFREYLERLLAAKTRKQEPGPIGGGETVVAPADPVFRLWEECAGLGASAAIEPSRARSPRRSRPAQRVARRHEMAISRERAKAFSLRY